MMKNEHPLATLRRTCAVIVVLLLCATASAQNEELKYSPALLTKAQNGNAEAQYKLAQCYVSGKETGVAMDEAKAVRWYKAAAQKGHADAMYSYAEYLLEGKYVPADTAGYRKYMLLAAEKGNQHALFTAALHYKYGMNGFGKDSVKAAGYYAKYHDIVKAKADGGDPVAQISLADLYAHTPQFKSEAHRAKDLYQKALETYKQRAEAGDAQSASRLGWNYFYGIEGYLNRDTLQAIKYYEMAVQNKPDYAYYKDRLAALFFARGDYAKALDYARKAMACPINERLYGAALIGHCYYKGLGVEKNVAEAVKYYQQVVANKNAYDFERLAHIELAHCYYYGQVVKTDYAQFVRLVDDVNLWGHPETIYMLAKCYIEGKGVKKDTAKGIDLIKYFNTDDKELRAKRDRLYFDATCAEAERYRTGNGVKKDYEKAADMLQRIKYSIKDAELQEKALIAADECRLALADSLLWMDSGDVMENKKKAANLFFSLGANGATDQLKGEGYYRYAICPYDYNGKKRDGVDIYYLRKGVELKHPMSLYLMGLLYVSGTGVEKDEMKAADLLRQAVATGDVEASTAVADFYLDLEMFTEARTIYEANAKKGSALAYFRLGQIYDNPNAGMLTGVPGLADAESAVKYYTKAAEMGLAEAQYRMSSVYGIMALEEEYPVEYDPDKARMWLTKAAEQGHLDAMAKLGDCYYFGTLATDINYREALKWLMPAAVLGNDDAMYDLGCMYEKGLGGLKKDSVKAISLFQQAARKGNFLAQDKMKEMGLTW